MISPSDFASGSNQQPADHTDWEAKLGITEVSHCDLLISEGENEKDWEANINISFECQLWSTSSKAARCFWKGYAS